MAGQSQRKEVSTYVSSFREANRYIWSLNLPDTISRSSNSQRYFRGTKSQSLKVLGHPLSDHQMTTRAATRLNRLTRSSNPQRYFRGTKPQSLKVLDHPLSDHQMTPRPAILSQIRKPAALSMTLVMPNSWLRPDEGAAALSYL
jgi:hypothetical protein